MILMNPSFAIFSALVSILSKHLGRDLKDAYIAIFTYVLK